MYLNMYIYYILLCIYIMQIFLSFFMFYLIKMYRSLSIHAYVCMHRI